MKFCSLQSSCTMANGCQHNKDFKVHADLCDQLLSHYTAQWADRQVYWKARAFSANRKGMLCVIIDTFDRAKLSLPKWPYGRTPKRATYEITNRSSNNDEILFHWVVGCFYLRNIDWFGLVTTVAQGGQWSWLQSYATDMAFTCTWPRKKGWAVGVLGMSNVSLAKAISNCEDFELFYISSSSFG